MIPQKSKDSGCENGVFNTDNFDQNDAKFRPPLNRAWSEARQGDIEMTKIKGRKDSDNTAEKERRALKKRHSLPPLRRTPAVKEEDENLPPIGENSGARDVIQNNSLDNPDRNSLDDDDSSLNNRRQMSYQQDSIESYDNNRDETRNRVSRGNSKEDSKSLRDDSIESISPAKSALDPLVPLFSSKQQKAAELQKKNLDATDVIREEDDSRSENRAKSEVKMAVFTHIWS